MSGDGRPSPRVRLAARPIGGVRADLLAVFAREGDAEPLGVADPALRAELGREMRAEDFRGRRGDLLPWNAPEGDGRRRYLVVGLGSPARPLADAVREGAARAARWAATSGAGSIAASVPASDEETVVESVRATVEGAILGAYSFDRYRTDPDRRRRTPLASLTVATDERTAARTKAARLGQAVGLSVCDVRDWVNEPASELTPRAFARRARAVARAAGLTIDVLDDRRLARDRFGALRAVGRGSDQPPCVVHLRYRPKGRPRGPRVLLVGKGVTFDSGGLNLKTGPGLKGMKGDMAGAAAVLGAMSVLRDVGCRVEVHGLLGLVENMPGGGAFRPGDILRSHSGKTIEVVDTDAEGRLVLADLLAYGGRRLGPDCIVDLATLTGACMVALGPLATGLFTRDVALRDSLLAAGARAGEKIWALPLYEEFLDPLRDGPADLRNYAERWGQASEAASFLGEFVPQGPAWAHLDIAGPAFAEKDRPDAPAGGTGAGVGTLVRWLETLG